MMWGMKHRLFGLYFALACLLTPVFALAKGEDEEAQLLEARLEGYTDPVRMDSGSTALTWLMFIFLAVVALAVMFKNAKRTHLD